MAKTSKAGTVVASYLVRVTLRDPVDRDKVSVDDNVPLESPTPPSNDELAGAVHDEIRRKFAAFEAHVTSERTDR